MLRCVEFFVRHCHVKFGMIPYFDHKDKKKNINSVVSVSVIILMI